NVREIKLQIIECWSSAPNPCPLTAFNVLTLKHLAIGGPLFGVCQRANAILRSAKNTIGCFNLANHNMSFLYNKFDRLSIVPGKQQSNITDVFCHANRIEIRVQEDLNLSFLTLKTKSEARGFSKTNKSQMDEKLGEAKRRGTVVGMGIEVGIGFGVGVGIGIESWGGCSVGTTPTATIAAIATKDDDDDEEEHEDDDRYYDDDDDDEDDDEDEEIARMKMGMEMAMPSRCAIACSLSLFLCVSTFSHLRVFILICIFDFVEYDIEVEKAFAVVTSVSTYAFSRLAQLVLNVTFTRGESLAPLYLCVTSDIMSQLLRLEIKYYLLTV
ncbi:hypothetical protein V1478_013364, partial [Vespula squamosa]